MFNDGKFIISITDLEKTPNLTGFNEYVFLGRSNVGKSSFINALLNRKILAKTSSKPGKTRTLNYFLIDDSFYLVDIPGYGYASTGLEQRLQFGNIIEKYLKKSTMLKVAFLLVDFKVGPTKDDLLMFELLKSLKINIKIIATKTDKIGITHRKKHLKKIEESLKLTALNIILTSAETRLGMEKVSELIKSYQKEG